MGEGMESGIDLPTAAGSLLAFAAATHIAVGAEAFLEAGTVLSALLITWGVVALCGVAATAAGLIPRRPAYLGGIALVGVSLVGYVDVYALGMAESTLGVEFQPPDGGHDHGSVAAGHQHEWQGRSDPSIGQRLASGHFALPSKLVELSVLALLVLLVRQE